MSTKSPRPKPWVWCAMVVFLVFSIPWYWPVDTIRPFIIGMPSWAFMSLLMSFLFALGTAWMIVRGWTDD